MKNLILALSITTLLVSCKKDEKKDFTATDVTGTSTVYGNVNKNVITPNGSGSFISTAKIAAKGIRVTITVNKNALYPNSNAQGADVYSATTDSLGNYSVSVKTNATGVNALISIDGFNGTLDTLINGSTKPGLYASYAGTSITKNLVMGQSTQVNHSFIASNVSSNPNTIVIGTAVITGSVGKSIIKEFTASVFGPFVVPVAAGQVVYLNFKNDPTLLAAKVYTTTTDANGYYTFNVATVAQSSPGFSQTADLWVNDFATTRDTLKLSGLKTGPAGVYQRDNTTQFGVFNNTIKNATHLTYTGFIAN